MVEPNMTYSVAQQKVLSQIGQLQHAQNRFSPGRKAGSFMFFPTSGRRTVRLLCCALLAILASERVSQLLQPGLDTDRRSSLREDATNRHKIHASHPKRRTAQVDCVGSCTFRISCRWSRENDQGIRLISHKG